MHSYTFAKTTKQSKMETKTLGDKLRELRTLRAMSQEYLANESRVGLRTIQRIENNESEPMGETLKRIATTLDVELSELIGSSAISATRDIKSTIIYLKKQLSKTSDKSEIKTFNAFIKILTGLREKNLSEEHREVTESFIQYLELEKIPSFNKLAFQQKLVELKKFLKTRLGLIPNNFYTTWTLGFGGSFALAFSVQSGIDPYLKIGVISMALLSLLLGILMDLKMKRKERTFIF